MLVFESQTTKELLLEIAEYIREAATRHKEHNNIEKRKAKQAQNLLVANILIGLAMDLEGAGMLPANSPFRKASPQIITAEPAEAWAALETHQRFGLLANAVGGANGQAVAGAYADETWAELPIQLQKRLAKTITRKAGN